MIKRLLLVAMLFPSVGFAALEFDGVSDVVDISDHADFDFSGAFTISMWANPDNTDSYEVPVYRYDNTSKDGFSLYQSTTGSGVWRFLIFEGGGSTYISSDAAPSGNWQHVCGVRDGSGNMYIYVDGVKQIDTAVDASAIDSSADLRFGLNFQDNGDYDGILQDVAIWSTNLSDDQVALLASSHMARIALQIESANLIGYWPLDDQPSGTASNGDTVYDISGSANQHNGTVTSSSNWAGGVLTYAQLLEWKPIYWLTRGSLGEGLPLDPSWIRRRLWL